MGKFDKAVGAMDDELLDEVNGGYVPVALNEKKESVLLGLYDYTKGQYHWYLENEPGSAGYYDVLEALECYEAELTRRGIPFSRD